MKKLERQSKIIQLIEQNEIETQEELLSKLMEENFYVTQATISRDIRELKLTKIATDDGRQKYTVVSNVSQHLSEKFLRVLKDGYISMERAQGLIVIRTLTGMAMAVAAALDALDFNEIVGCIAGDDTIFCAIRSEEDILNLMNRINRVIQYGFEE